MDAMRNSSFIVFYQGKSGLSALRVSIFLIEGQGKKGQIACIYEKRQTQQKGENNIVKENPSLRNLSSFLYSVP